ncbi:MAG: aldehyde dehydrogenase family protein [Myxococcales bacterium]|nr:aldehyde dehydrogenase family protein [Myxococcales bacterium]MCB9629589.1 aldehyde dehydrogenase family protein [Sandaracinaceae bacterium]
MSTSAALPIGSVAIPEAVHTIPPTSREAMDAAVNAIAAQKDKWVGLSIAERVKLLDVLMDRTLSEAERWAAAGLKAKGISPSSPTAGEEWLAGPAVMARNIRLLKRSLLEIERFGAPQLPAEPYARADGRVVATVFPTDNWDKITFTGFSAEVWMEPEVTLANLPDHMAEFYRTRPTTGKVALVLGAGNVSSIGPMDALYKLFVEGQVVILKMNPVNENLGPVFADIFQPLSDRGFFRLVYGGAAEGDYLCNHEGVEEIHITGSDKTYDAIVWGLGAEGERRKREGQPRNTRRVSSELGNVSPIIVVPGPWSQKDIAYQGVNLASSLTNNAGFNCNATRVIIQHASWSQRDALNRAVGDALSRAEPRVPYYPGAEERHDRFLAAHPEARQFGPDGTGKVPWTFIPGVASADAGDICFNTEAWCGVTSETALEAGSVVEYIERAVDFANDRLWGTLSCSIIVHPKSLEDPAVANAVEKAIADLRFGSVAVNHWAALSYAFVSTTWGAYPGHPPEDIRSGSGVVHNSYLFDKPQKSVVRGPFIVKPRPAWFNDHKTCNKLGPLLTRFNGKPSVRTLLPMLGQALRG